MLKKSLMFTGAPATGKTTILKAVSEQYKLEIMPGHTTRPMRENEIQGRDYFF